MEYKGYKVKECTAIGAYDTPRRMLALMAPALKSLEDPFDGRLDTPLTPEEP